MSLEDADGWLHASIVDHGCGFDTEEPSVKGSGCGLAGMRERASVIGAMLSLRSGAEGTTITLVAPMSVAEDKEAAL